MNKLPINPFQYGVVIDDRAFCNRKEEIAYLKNQIINGYSTWLFSPRRFGKTSLIEKVFRELDDTRCIYLDLYNIKSIDDFSRKYSQVIAKSLFNWKNDIKRLTKRLSEAFTKLSPTVSFDEFGNPSLSLNVHKVEKQQDIVTILDIPFKISSTSSERICVAFDEFQEISRIDPFLLNWMRSSFQKHARISYIFSGSKQSLMEDIFSSAQSPFYEFAAKMNLSTISRIELFRFIKDNFTKNNLYIEDHTINDIIEKSECQPHFTQYFASVVYDLVMAGADQNIDNFQDSWMKRIIISQADVFQDIYDQLTNSQRATLYAIAELNNPGIYSEESRINYGLPVSSSLNEVLKSLQKKGLVYKSEDTYKITNPVFKEWLLELD
jgi:AAA+ ATPase superfamily predicted ATPase